MTTASRWAILLPINIECAYQDQALAIKEAIDILLDVPGAEYRQLNAVFHDFDGTTMYETVPPPST